MEELKTAIAEVEAQLPINFKCGVCGRVIHSKNGMFNHINKKHPGEDRGGYCPTTDPVEHERSTKKRKHKVVPTAETAANLPSTKYIDVPITIRIPIHFGTVEVVNE